MYGPTGIGVLYGKKELLEAMPPWQGGGDMIRSVSFEGTTYNDLPYKFERAPRHRRGHRAGGGHRLPAAIGMDAVAAHEHDLLPTRPRRCEGQGPSASSHCRRKAGVVSFVIDGITPHDIGSLVDRRRRGHPHRPPLRPARDGPLPAAGHLRASLALYNTKADVDALVASLQKVVEMFT